MGEFELTHVAEARLEVELVCCRLAAGRRTDAQLAMMADEVARQRDATLLDAEFCASDVRFHRTLVAAAGNPALEFAAAGVLDSLQPAVNLVVFRFRDRRQVAAQHDRIHGALAARDATAACAALTDYMNALGRQYRKAQALRPRPAEPKGTAHG